jgi:outer membrane cobalamin receptor
MSPNVVSGIDARTRKVQSVRAFVAVALSCAAWSAMAQTQESAPRPVIELEDVVVVGTRLRGPGTGDSHLPIKVFDSDEIARTGATNIADVLDYLPSKTLGVNEQTNPSAAQFVQLRGLSLGNTLV